MVLKKLLLLKHIKGINTVIIKTKLVKSSILVTPLVPKYATIKVINNIQYYTLTVFKFSVKSGINENKIHAKSTCLM